MRSRQHKKEPTEKTNLSPFLQKGPPSSFFGNADSFFLPSVVQTRPALNEPVEKPEPAAGDKSVEAGLLSSKGKGNPLPADVREQMEYSFGADFSGVRVHTDNTAVKMNKALNAQAFTNGNDIYFNTGKYNLEGKEGKKLLAHELTHTIQQGSPNQVRRNGNDTEAGMVNPVYENLRNYFRGEDLQGAITLVTTMNSEQKDYVLSSTEFKNLATRGSTGGADFGDESITKLMESFLSNGYQNLYWCLDWLFYEFDPDDNNNEKFLRIIRRHTNESQKATVRAWMKEKFTEYLGDRGMADVVKLLGGPLYEKLLWIKDEGVDSWNLAYDVIIDHLSRQNITKQDSNTIYNNPQGKGDMRWYFGRDIDVGDYTMVRVVDLLGFELYQKLDWMIYEDTNLPLVLNVIGSSSQPEIKAVLDNKLLFDRLEQSLGQWAAYYTAFTAMKEAAGLQEKPEQPLSISILDSTITKELEPGFVSVPESYQKLYAHGIFLLESAKDQFRLAVNNPAVTQEAKEWWAYDINYLEGFLKMHHQFLEAESEAEDIPEGEIEEIASATTKRSSATVQASFVQASGFWGAVRGGFRGGFRGGIKGGIRTSARLSPPEVTAPSVARPVFPGGSGSWRPTFPSGSGSFPAASGSTTSTLTRVINIARGVSKYPVPPVHPGPQPPAEPVQEPKDSFDRFEWKEETSRKLKEMRRQIEEMKAARSARPATETEPEKEQQTEQKRRRRKLCYRLSIVLRRAGSGFEVENEGGITPDDLRIPACRERTRTGTTDDDFMLRNIAVGRFIVEGTFRTIATPNPERDYHSEDEMFRLANEQFGSGNFTLDALFTERRPCNRCSPIITRFPLTNTFRVYCIINNDYNWTQIREHYNAGVLF